MSEVSAVYRWCRCVWWPVCCMALSLLLSACSDDEAGTEAGTDNRIRFDAGKVVKNRKIINSPADFVQGDAFGVYGSSYVTGNIQGQNHIFENEKVSLSGQLWVYATTKYWEYGNMYAFRAFYPYADQSVQNPLYRLANDFSEQEGQDRYTISDFSVNENITEQVDLMVSNVEKRNLMQFIAGQGTQTVGFTFNHLLTKVDVKVKKAADFPENWKIVSLYARLYGMKTKGDYISETGQWNSDAFEGDQAGYSSSYENETAGLLTAANPEITLWKNQTAGQDGLLLLPQSNMSAVNIELRFWVEYNDGNGVKQKKVIIAVHPLPAATLWKPASQILYTAELKATAEIKFMKPTIEPWVVSKNSNSVVIK